MLELTHLNKDKHYIHSDTLELLKSFRELGSITKLQKAMRYSPYLYFI